MATVKIQFNITGLELKIKHRVSQQSQNITLDLKGIKIHSNNPVTYFALIRNINYSVLFICQRHKRKRVEQSAH